LEKLTRDSEASAGALRSLALLDLDSGNMIPPQKRYRELVVAGRLSEGLFRLDRSSERRNANDDAIELYTRVTEGDFAVAAQGRAARLKARAGSGV